MKNLKLNVNVFFYAIVIFLFSCPAQVLAQSGQQALVQTKVNKIHETIPIEVSMNQTVHIYFPASIKDADLGSNSFIAQKPKGVSNELKLKANKLFYNQSNLTVTTSDGVAYHFLVKYNAQPHKLRISLLPKTSTSKNSLLSSPAKVDEENSEMELKDLAGRAAENPINLNIKRNWVGMKLVINGIYVKDDLIFVRFILDNKSLIRYDIKQINAYIVDKKQSKRTSYQKQQLFPLLVYTVPGSLNPKETRVSGKTRLEKVVVFSKFNISTSKLLQMEILEENEGRSISAYINNARLLRASKLSLKGKGGSE